MEEKEKFVISINPDMTLVRESGMTVLLIDENVTTEYQMMWFNRCDPDELTREVMELNRGYCIIVPEHYIGMLLIREVLEETKIRLEKSIMMEWRCGDTHNKMFMSSPYWADIIRGSESWIDAFCWIERFRGQIQSYSTRVINQKRCSEPATSISLVNNLLFIRVQKQLSLSPNYKTQDLLLNHLKTVSSPVSADNIYISMLGDHIALRSDDASTDYRIRILFPGNPDKSRQDYTILKSDKKTDTVILSPSFYGIIIFYMYEDGCYEAFGYLLKGGKDVYVSTIQSTDQLNELQASLIMYKMTHVLGSGIIWENRKVNGRCETFIEQIDYTSIHEIKYIDIITA